MKQPTMKEMFEQCQNSMKSHSNLLKNMEKLYEKTEFTEFWPQFSHLLKYPMIVFQREPVVERTIDFIAKFVTSVNPDPNIPNNDPDDSVLDEVSQNKLLLEMFEFLLKSHNVNSRAVRFRCCQLINKILNNLGDDAQIDDDLYDKIYQCMLERLRDKEPVVRFHAVMALARLQDPKDENCPVIKAYLYLIQSDPNPEVRRAVLSCIAPSPKTLQAILEKTRDVKDTVRKTAYSVLGEKVHIKALSIANRERLLQEGLTDRVESVKEACSSKLLQAWLRTFGGNVLELLGALDVEYSTETCELVLNTLFKHSTTTELIKNFDILDEKVLISQDKLNAESVMYWNLLCKHIHGLGTDFDADLEKVLPNCLEFANYIKEYVDSLKDCDDIDVQLQKHFVIQQLLAVTVFMDLADTVSRKAMETLLHYMLTADHVAFNLVKYIIPRLCEIKEYSDSLVNQMAETISDIREPITTIDNGVDEESRRQNDVKIAGIRVKINQLKEELDESIRSQNFTKAADIKESIQSLDEERDQLLKDNEPQVKEVRAEEKTDVATLLKCQAIVAEMLEALPLKTLNPSLQTLIETLILPGIMNEDAGIRNMAVRSLGMCCLLNKDLVLVHLPLFMQASQIDVECVRITSLKVMIDLLHMHGTEAIKHGAQKSTEAQLNTSCDLYEEPDNSEQASKLVAFLTAFLDSQNSELRTVAAEGMSKLMLSGRVVSSKILSHLLLLWYNPVTEDDTHLRHCLGTFLPIFAFAGRSNQEIIEEAFFPTLKTIINAPLSSPLAEVNADNVAELLVQLTNTKLLMENQKSEEQITENPGHDSLAITVCNEILSNPETTNLKLFVKILNQLEFSPNNVTNLKEIAVLIDKLLKVVKDNQCLKTIGKMKTYVGSLLPDEPSVMEQGDTTVDQTEATQDKGDGDRLNTSIDRSLLNDTAQQLDGSLFQESRTLKRIKSITSTKSLDSSDVDADVRELPVFPEIQEEPETPRLIGVITPSRNIRRTPAKGQTPVKGQTPSKGLAPSKLLTEDNTPCKAAGKGKAKDKSPEKEKVAKKPQSPVRGRTPTKRKTTDDEKSPIESKSPRREMRSPTKEKSSPRQGLFIKNKTSTRQKTKPPTPTKSPSKTSQKGTSPSRTEKSPVKSGSAAKDNSISKKGKPETPTKEKTTRSRQNKEKSPTTRSGKSPVKAQTPTKEKSDAKSQSPVKSPAKSQTPTKGKSQTQTKEKSPVKSQSPTEKKSPTKQTRGRSPNRSQSPVKGRSVTTEKKSPTKQTRGRSPTKSQLPVKGKSVTTEKKSTTKQTRENSPTRSQSPVKGKSSTRSQSPTKGKSPTRTEKNPAKQEIAAKAQTRRGMPLRGQSPSGKETSPTKSQTPTKRKLPTIEATSNQGKSPARSELPGGKSPKIAGKSPSVAQQSTRGKLSSKIADKNKSLTNPSKTVRGAADKTKTQVKATCISDNGSKSPSPIKSTRRNVRGTKSTVLSDSELSTDSSVKSPRGRRNVDTATSDDDEVPSTDTSVMSVTRGTRKKRNISGDSDLASTDSSVISVTRGSRQKRNVSDDDLPSTDSTLRSSPRNTRKKITKVDAAAKTSNTKKTSVSSSSGETKSTARSTRNKTVTTSDEDSVKSASPVVRGKRSTAARRTTDDDSQTTDSSVVSSTRGTKKKPAVARQSVIVQELSADSDTETSEFSSPTRVSRQTIKSTRKRTKELDTIHDESDIENTVFESPARGTRSTKSTKKLKEEEPASRQSLRSTRESKTTEVPQSRPRRATLKAKQVD